MSWIETRLSLRKPIDSYWFKTSCLGFLVIICVHCFLLKMMKLCVHYYVLTICSAWITDKPYFCRIFFLIDWRHKCLKNTIDLFLFYGEHFYGFSESALGRALHYPFNWRFLEINKLRNVIAENLIFSKNRKLISISWKAWTCSNFSTNWKWMNCIRHERKKVVGKEKF